MNKFVMTALAIGAAGSVAQADPNGDDWLELDNEISSLSSAVSTQGPISGWAVLLRSTFEYSEDDLASAADDVSGFYFEDVRIATWGEIGDYGWRVSMNAGSFSGIGNSFIVEDAHAYWMCGEYFTATMGRYRPTVFRNSDLDEENLLFISRTLLGSAFDFFDEGIGASGSFEDFTWNLDILNGGNTDLSDHFWLLRGAYHFNGGAGDYEGAYGASDDLAGTIGLVYAMDDTMSGDTSMIGIDANGSVGQFGFGFEVAFLDEDLTANTKGKFAGTAAGLSLNDPGDDTTPWSITGSYLLNNEWEVGARYEDTDNGTDDTVLTVGAVWYHSGKNAKWNAEVSQIDTDAAADDATIVRVGVTLGGTR